MFKKTMIVAASTAIIVSSSVMAQAPVKVEGTSTRKENSFKKADTNSDGAITKEEYLAKANASYKKETKEEYLAKADKRFTKIDANSDGKISLEEFKTKPVSKKK